MRQRIVTCTGVIISIALFHFACSSPPPKPASSTANTNANANGNSSPSPTPDSPAAPTELFGTAVIAGKVTYDGVRPIAKPIKMGGDPVCAKAQTAIDQSKELAADGGVPHVFVYIKQGISQKYPVPAQTVILDQTGCMYVPHVFGIQVGQTLTIRNSDPTAHNVHSLAQKNQQFNVSQASAGMTKNEVFSREEIMVKVKCDVHGWMSSFAGVLNHPFFAVTDANGEFSIPKLPAGSYTVEIWHETFQRQTKKIDLKDGETLKLDFVYSKANKP